MTRFSHFPRPERICFGLLLATIMPCLPVRAVFSTNAPTVQAQIVSNKVVLDWFPGLPGHIYTVETRDSLGTGDWDTALGGWPIDESSWAEPIRPGIPTLFYRVVSEPGAIEFHSPPLAFSALGDTDEDGLSDYEENRLGTDPTLADSDGDGLVDGYEVFLSNDPIVGPLAISPLAPDSNGDFIDDFLEVVVRVNGIPLPETGLTDTDMEGLTDREEFFLRTDPGNPDTDGDGVSDFEELTMGGNPRNAADMGDGSYYQQFGSPEEMYFLFDPGLMGTGIDTLKETIGYIEPPMPGGGGREPASGGGAPTGNRPIGSGEGGRDIFMVYIVTLESGEQAGVVPRNVCPTGLIRLCPQILREEQVTLRNGMTITMTTIIPFDQIPFQVLQQCCVNDAGVVDPDSLLGRLAELFGNDIDILRTVANYVLKHGLFVLNEADRDRMFGTRLKLTRCCNLDVVPATAIAMAIMVAVNTDNIAVDFLLQLLPGIPGTPFNIGDAITLADRALLGGVLGDFADGLIPDEAVTQFLCNLMMKYYCRNRVNPLPPGCPGEDEALLPGAYTPGRPPGSGEADPDEPGDGNGRGESVGHSVPVCYGREDPPEDNPKGNKPPPGGAGEREAKESGGGEAGIAGNKGGGQGGRKGIPPGGTPWGPILIPYIIDDPPPTNFPSGWSFEFGDAPDLDLPTGYPAPDDTVIGRFPTIFHTANSRYGQPGAHILGPGYVWLGVRYSRELDAILGDRDLETNLNVPLKLSNRDYYDDGLVLPVTVNPCGLTALHVTVNSWSDTPLETVYINVLIDFNRDGEWSGAVEGADEWAVKNYAVEIAVGTEQVVALPPFQTPCEPFPAWVRILLSDLEVPLDGLGNVDGWDGSGWYNFGEVEDYFLEP